MIRRTMHSTACALALAIVSAGCLVETERLDSRQDADPGAFYTRAEIDAKFGFPAGCAEGDVPVRGSSSWSCGDQVACPGDFSASTEDGFTVCARTLLEVDDVMVRVASFWIDRYELSVCGGGSPGDAAGDDTSTAACSTPGAVPNNVTWFQAAQLCANAGKHLCTNAEWQTAAAGTTDPGVSDGADGSCATMAAEPRMAGGGTSCRSRFGAEDMIGNLWEWVDAWHITGVPFMLVDTEARTPWPTGDYGDGLDQSFNVNGSSTTATAFVEGAPAATLRGGSRLQGATSGAFAISLSTAPSYIDPSIGARCCLRAK